MTDITELAQQELAQLRAELSNQAIGSKDHLRKIALSLVDKLEKCRDREIRWLALSDEKSKIITDQEEALEKAQQRNGELETYSKTAIEFREAARDENRHLKLELEIAEKRIAELEPFHTAYMEWSDKTAWVQTDKRFDVLKPWGKHRADVLKEYIQHLESRTVIVKLPQPISVLHRRDFTDAHCAIYAYPEAEVNAALASAGIKVEAE